MSEQPPPAPMTAQERSDMWATEGLRTTHGPGARKDNTAALMEIMEKELDLLPMSEVTIVFKSKDGHIDTLICNKASVDVTQVSLIEDEAKILKVSENKPDPRDIMRRLWAIFSKSAIVNNYDIDRFTIVNEHGVAIIEALDMGLLGIVELELNKFYLYIRNSQSYNGFTVTTFTQDNVKVEVPNVTEQRRPGLINRMMGRD